MKNFLLILTASFSLLSSPAWATGINTVKPEALYSKIFHVSFIALGLIIFMGWLLCVIHLFFKAETTVEILEYNKNFDRFAFVLVTPILLLLLMRLFL